MSTFQNAQKREAFFFEMRMGVGGGFRFEGGGLFSTRSHLPQPIFCPVLPLNHAQTSRRVLLRLTHKKFSSKNRNHFTPQRQELMMSKKAKLPEAELPEAELPEAELPEAELPEAELPEAELPEAELPEAEQADDRTSIEPKAPLAEAEAILLWLKTQPSTPENKALRAKASIVVEYLKSR